MHINTGNMMKLKVALNQQVYTDISWCKLNKALVIQVLQGNASQDKLRQMIYSK